MRRRHGGLPGRLRSAGGVLRVLLLAPLLLAASASGAASEADAAARIDEAIAAYTAAMESRDRDQRLEGFRHSERLFAAAADDGAANALLYTNLGNAALQAERLGPAILAYRRALLLEPAQARARQNLAHARGLLPDWVPTPPQASLLDSFFFWQTSSSSAARGDAAAVAFAIAILAAAAGIRFRSAGPRYLAIPAALVWLSLILSLVFDPSRTAGHEVVVVAEEAIARAADSINSPQRFGEALPGGTEVRILEDRGGWVQIELHNGRNAWLSASAVERISP